MAVIMVLAGGILGFVSGLIALFVLNLGVLISLAIWSGVGLSFALAGIGLMALPRPQFRGQRTRTA